MKGDSEKVIGPSRAPFQCVRFHLRRLDIKYAGVISVPTIIKSGPEKVTVFFWLPQADGKKLKTRLQNLFYPFRW